MEIQYKKNHFATKVIYGETFAATLPSLNYHSKHLILITNQRYYDLFSEKINRLLAHHTNVDWYICTNQTHCNKLDELNNLLAYLARFTQDEEYLFLAFGNEGVVELTSYIQKNTVLKGNFWVLPVSIRSFAQGLTVKTEILSQQEHPLLQTENMPQMILYDQTLTQEQTTGKMVDLLIFIVCGIICDQHFLRELYFNYPNRKNLQSIPFTGMIESILRFYEKCGDAIEDYGRVFEWAFYHTEGSHLLSSSMKRMLGILFHFRWNIEIADLDFNYRNFLKWLLKLGLPLQLPDEFLIGDYVDNVLQVMKKSEGLLYLKKIGEVAGFCRATSEELLQTVESYQNIVADIF